jgi:hypothetical protein
LVSLISQVIQLIKLIDIIGWLLPALILFLLNLGGPKLASHSGTLGDLSILGLQLHIYSRLGLLATHANIEWIKFLTIHILPIQIHLFQCQLASISGCCSTHSTCISLTKEIGSLPIICLFLLLSHLLQFVHLLIVL